MSSASSSLLHLPGLQPAAAAAVAFSTRALLTSLFQSLFSEHELRLWQSASAVYLHIMTFDLIKCFLILPPRGTAIFGVIW